MQKHFLDLVVLRIEKTHYQVVHCANNQMDRNKARKGCIDMFVSFSKTMAKFGKVRIGVGLRVTKKNAAWMSFLLLFVLIFEMMWYLMVLCFWVIYAVCYGMYWCIRQLCRKLRKADTQ